MTLKPKLLVVADTYYPKVDGILKFIEQFIARSRSHFDIHLLVPHLRDYKKREDFLQKKRSSVTYVAPSRIISLSGYPSIQLSSQNILQIKSAIKQADIVFIQGPALLCYLSMYYAPQFHKKTIFYLHVVPWELFAKFAPPILNKVLAFITKRISIMLYNRCDEILVPYPELKEYLRHEGVKTTITVARLGVDIDRFNPATSAENKEEWKRKMGLDPQKKVIGYVGRISREKNTQVLLDAFKKLKRKEELSLLLVGDGPKEQKKVCTQISNCHVTGFVDNVQDYLRAMDIFVMPSLTETTSLATLEAMACGLPVITTRIGFMQSYIAKGYNGTFFPRNNSTVLAVKINQLLKEKELRLRLGHNARKTVAYSFSWERSINRIKRILLRKREK